MPKSWLQSPLSSPPIKTNSPSPSPMPVLSDNFSPAPRTPAARSPSPSPPPDSPRLEVEATTSQPGRSDVVRTLVTETIGAITVSICYLLFQKIKMENKKGIVSFNQNI